MAASWSAVRVTTLGFERFFGLGTEEPTVPLVKFRAILPASEK